MKLSEIKAKQKELYFDIVELQLREQKNDLTDFEQNHLNLLRQNYSELSKLIPAAEVEEKRTEYGDEYAKLFAERQEILTRKGVQMPNVLKRKQELDKLLSVIENKKK
ncbi:MAG: hypothetical protein WCL06_13370 [Bacteroidota bacterium]